MQTFQEFSAIFWVSLSTYKSWKSLAMLAKNLQLTPFNSKTQYQNYAHNKKWSSNNQGNIKADLLEVLRHFSGFFQLH